ncbi:RNA polymerase sigma factor [Anaerostipes sp.]|uniref:RNA polymerase sigma factor n=1 Tax=Anaerostipes sp. TaxID=1872530 RepID=UPI0025BB5478|nr:RNA polymerase sigma factor [Anaerostipes sp.]MBS7007407.1 RNA polymerase sigma factor [Anaerostipes sp.]
MIKNTNEELSKLIEDAANGDKEALEAVILSVRDLIFNLSLRMLGTFADAEDATQDIILKIMTHLSTFRKESSFSTWVFSISKNHLINYKKHMFVHAPLSFEFYGNDIENAPIQDIPDLTQNVEEELLAEELKMSCTNVMLQCLDPESRCIFILGTMFQLDSRTAGEVLHLSPEAYRQRLSRIRRKMADFLEAYCGEYGSGKCRCKNRINYAVQSRRLDPSHLEYTCSNAASDQICRDFKNAMEDIDGLSQKFSFCRLYESPEKVRAFVSDFLDSVSLSVVKNS